MSEPLTNEELAEIEARERTASPGPWQAMPNSWEYTTVEGPDRKRIARTQYHGDPDEEMVPELEFVHDVDAEFIAQSRTDIPKLCAEVRRLQAELAALKKKLKTADGNVVSLVAENERLRTDAIPIEGSYIARREGFADQKCTVAWGRYNDAECYIAMWFDESAANGFDSVDSLHKQGWRFSRIPTPGGTK